ncbi:DnaJ domain-containing protein [bacterium]|nr:DnaJ domain-containing protein [bacterium]
MSLKKEYLNVLGLNEDASLEEIKKKYRKLSLKCHPDKEGGSAEEFIKISEAYEKLNSGELEMNNNKDVNVENFNAGDFFHFFNNPNISNFQNIRINKPAAIIKRVELTLKQCYLGAMIPVDIERNIIEGNTLKKESENIYVNIKKGIDANEIIIYRGKGHITDNGIQGDVKIIFVIKEDENFERNGLDLIYKKTISLKEALCGCNFQMDHLSGKKYKITNSGTNTILTPNYLKIIPNLGIERGNHKGNLCIKFNIIFPSQLTKIQVESLEKIL